MTEIVYEKIADNYCGEKTFLLLKLTVFNVLESREIVSNCYFILR